MIILTARVGAVLLVDLSYLDTEHKPGSFPNPILLCPHNIPWSKNDYLNTASVLIL